MSHLDIQYTKKKFPLLHRVMTILPGAIALSILCLVFIGYSIFASALPTDIPNLIFVIAFFIITYYVWWIIRGLEYAVLIFQSIFHLQEYEKRNFAEALQTKELASDLKSAELIHRFMIPMYNEDAEILMETVSHIANANYDLSRVAVTLNGENAKRELYEEAWQQVREKFEGVFWFLDGTCHVLTPEEMPGKWANITSAAKSIYKDILKHFNAQPEQVMLTTLDADTNIDKEYMNIMSYTYLTTPDRKYKSYQPVIFFFNNFRSAPFFSQVISLLNTFWILFNFTKRYGTRNFSTHMQPLDALIELDFWSVQTIVEDGHQYRRSFFGFNGKYECIPVYTKVYQDCNLNTDIFETAKAQYKQMRRWAHGAEDISYVAEQMKDKWKHLPKQRSIFEFIRLLEGTILWSTLHFVLLSGLMFTLIRDVQLSSYLSLGSTISLFTNISLVMMVIVVSLQLFLCPWHQLKFGYKKIRKVVEFIFIFGFLLWPTLFIFSGIPALHTQLGIMLGKPLKKFNVTDKIRK